MSISFLFYFALVFPATFVGFDIDFPKVLKIFILFQNIAFHFLLFVSVMFCFYIFGAFALIILPCVVLFSF